MKISKAVLGAFYGEVEPTDVPQVSALEAALAQWQKEHLDYLDSLTHDQETAENKDYLDGWSDCREDVERAYDILGEL